MTRAPRIASSARARPSRVLGLSLLLPLLTAEGGCVTKRYEKPTVSSEALIRSDAPVEDDGTIATLPWESLFTDPVLRGLIADALERNLQLKVALARIEVAQANLTQSRAAFAPTLQLDAQYGMSKQAAVLFPTRRVTLAQVAASASWELDVWGKLRSMRRVSEAQLQASWAFRRAIQTQLIADVATAYYTLLAYDRELAITEEAVRVRIQDVEAVKALKQGAVVTGADVVQSEANRYAAEVTIPDIKRDIREVENALSVLLARPPSAIARGKLDEQTTPAVLQVGVAAQLIAHRPDVQQAELEFRSAFELTNVARTYFYPALTLSGSAGFASQEFGDLFSPGSFIGNLVGNLMQPILNRGVNRQRLQVARAQQKEAFYTFQETALRAGQEVSNALYSYEMATAKAEARKLQLEALGKAVEFTKELLRYTSNTNYVDVLTSEQSLLSAQINAINDRLQQLQAVVSLYRALGGGASVPPDSSADATK